MWSHCTCDPHSPGPSLQPPLLCTYSPTTRSSVLGGAAREGMQERMIRGSWKGGMDKVTSDPWRVLA